MALAAKVNPGIRVVWHDGLDRHVVIPALSICDTVVALDLIALIDRTPVAAHKRAFTIKAAVCFTVVIVPSNVGFCTVSSTLHESFCSYTLNMHTL